MLRAPVDTPFSEQNPLRTTFVEMLFALAVGQVAIHTADLVSINASWYHKLPAASHLILSVLLIATSWIGWRQSASPGTKYVAKTLFSRPFLTLLVDVALVVLYFVIVRQVEIVQRSGETILGTPSALPEALWIGVVFAVYAFWDLIADVLSPGCIPSGTPSFRFWKGVRAGVVCTFASLACLFLSLFVYWIAKTEQSAINVVLLDFVLIAVILLFRTMKAFENTLAPLFGVTDCNAFSSPRPIDGDEFFWSFTLLVIYGGLVVLVLLPAAAQKL